VSEMTSLFVHFKTLSYTGWGLSCNHTHTHSLDIATMCQYKKTNITTVTVWCETFQINM